MSISVSLTFPHQLSEVHLKELHRIINESYLSSERDFWHAHLYERISINDLEKELRKKNVCVAFLGPDPVGCLKVNNLENEGAEFGMLCVEMEHRRKGIAARLVEMAEEWARENGRKVMQMQLLMPSEFKHEDKELLKKWYDRIGYQPVKTAPFEDYHPQLVPLMKIPCTFEVWSKSLE